MFCCLEDMSIKAQFYLNKKTAKEVIVYNITITSEFGSISATMADVVLTMVVMTVVRVIRGSATESRFLPYTVTTVPPLYVLHTYIFKLRVRFNEIKLFKTVGLNNEIIRKCCSYFKFPLPSELLDKRRDKFQSNFMLCTGILHYFGIKT